MEIYKKIILWMGCAALIVVALSVLIRFVFFQPMDSTSHVLPKYIDNQQCLSCHQTEARQWLNSHHAQAMAEANDKTVLGNFNNAIFNHQGVVTRFFRREGKYYVHTDDSNGKLADFPIKYTFGVDPLQQYLIELPGGRLQNFTIAWDTRHKRWFHLYPNEKAMSGDIMHWTGRYQSANTMCMACHTTHLQKNYDAKTDTFATTWSEINVSCQSCHGPGSFHVSWAKGDHKEFVAAKGLVNLHGEKQIETCAICHSRRSELTTHPQAGQPLMDNYLPVLLNEGMYYPDGQQQAEVYVYGSFRQSKMYQSGVVCTDCHNPHTGKLKLSGNAVCTQCHQPQLQPRFPAAAKLYDSPAHHHHKMGTPGAQCISCHMPERNYMIVHARPDHRFAIPRPDLSIQLGTPNACTQCHKNKSAQWAADIILKWYGPIHESKRDFALPFAAGRLGKNAAKQSLMALSNKEDEPDIVRATALYLLGNYGADSVSTRINHLHDHDPTVRRAAVMSLQNLPSSQRLEVIAPLLTDLILAVRIEAARILSSIPTDQFSSARYRAYKIALAEYVDAQNQSLEMPGSHFNLAMIWQNSQQPAKAEVEYQKALQFDPDFIRARLNLARLYHLLGRNQEAEQVLREGLQRLPEQGELHYSLGLLLAEQQRLPEATAELAKAAKLLSQRSRVHYNYGLALQELGQYEAAKKELQKAQALAP